MTTLVTRSTPQLAKGMGDTALGVLCLVVPAHSEGFLYSDGFYTAKCPLGSTRIASGINDEGQIVSAFSNGSATFGFQYSNGGGADQC
ncbi:hypothetical protein [Bradyrhizobium genomosp. III]|uniref:hypothetical protein n=1 Tax=Bradyrhizobium genomosp. III TaxID=2683271 RepID=UPI000577F686|nr:hypothetical protein [Bradyrhizobium sp. CCBAU 15635]